MEIDVANYGGTTAFVDSISGELQSETERVPMSQPLWKNFPLFPKQTLNLKSTRLIEKSQLERLIAKNFKLIVSVKFCDAGNRRSVKKLLLEYLYDPTTNGVVFFNSDLTN